MTFDTRWTCAFVDSVWGGGIVTRGKVSLPTVVDATGNMLDIVYGLKNPTQASKNEGCSRHCCCRVLDDEGCNGIFWECRFVTGGLVTTAKAG